jgi:hypothetical protein
MFRQVTHALLVNAILGSSLGAGPKESTKSLLARYKAATCVPSARTPYRSWDAELAVSNGSKVVIKAAEIPGGLVMVTDLGSGDQFVAANAGDYVYPHDIRIDKQRDLLYIIASGLAGGLWWRTVLFEYDLRSHQRTARRRIKDKGLPKACPGPSES